MRNLGIIMIVLILTILTGCGNTPVEKGENQCLQTLILGGYAYVLRENPGVKEPQIVKEIENSIEMFNRVLEKDGEEEAKLFLAMYELLGRKTINTPQKKEEMAKKYRHLLKKIKIECQYIPSWHSKIL